IGGGIGQPIALPGSRGVLFEYCASQCVTMGMHVLDLKSGKQRLLLDGMAGAWYLPTGQLFYVQRDGAGLVVPFSLSGLRVTGGATPIVSGISLSQSEASPLLTISATGTLVYVPGGGAQDGQMVRVSRSGVVTPLDTNWHGQIT